MTNNKIKGLKARRKALGMNQQEMASVLNVSLNAYRNKESGKTELLAREDWKINKLFEDDSFKLITSDGTVYFKDDIYTSFKVAKKKFDGLTKDARNGKITNNTIDWAQIIYCPIDSENDIVVDDFGLNDEQTRLKEIISGFTI